MVCKSQKCDKGNHHQSLNIIIQKDNFSFPDFCLGGRAIRLSGVRRIQSGTVTGASSSCSEGHKAKYVSMLVRAWPNTLVWLKFGNFQNFVFVVALELIL